MPAFQWEDSFLTGLPVVDEQHWKLVDLLNRFSCVVEEGEGVPRERLEELFRELLDYASYHFLYEELLLADWDLDARHRDPHVTAHAEFILQVRQLKAEMDSGAKDTAKPLLAFMSHWLAYHILGTDRAMALQVQAIQEGQCPAEAFTAASSPADSATQALLNALNGLIEILSFRNRQLLELNQSLERRVAERTDDLSRANLELQAAIARLETERAESLRLGRELAKANEILASQALTDALTGLPNRRQAMQRLESEWSESVRSGRPFSVVVVDADGFKGINDHHGHDAGDQVLAALAEALRSSFRAYDVVCRLGGDEFLVLCPDTPLEGAIATAERSRSAIQDRSFPAGSGRWQGSVSVGVAARGPDQAGPEALLKAADEALYAAKRHGRNRVEASLGAG